MNCWMEDGRVSALIPGRCSDTLAAVLSNVEPVCLEMYHQCEHGGQTC